ncbi:MAG: hypothetical protein NXI30_04660 [bacterium]|nr:hypothetical protein [bacterium]
MPTEFDALFDDAAAEVLATPEFPDPDAPRADLLGATLMSTLGTSPEAMDRIDEINPRRLTAEDPVTAGIASDQDLTAVAEPDLENMWMIERISRETADGFKRGELGRQLGRLSFDDLVQGPDELRELEMQYLERQIGERPDFGVPDEGISGILLNTPSVVAEALPHMAETLVSGVEGGVVGAAGAAPIGAMAGLPAGPGGALAGARAAASEGFKLGGSLAVFASSARAEAGHAFRELQRVTDNDGVPVDRDLARAMALGVGGVNGLLERFGLSRVLRDVPGVGQITGVFSRKAATEALRNPALRRAFAGFAGSITEGAATEAITEALQEGVQIASVLLAGAAQGQGVDEFTHVLEDPSTGEPLELTGSDAVWARILSALEQGAQAGGGLSAAGRLSRVVADSSLAERAVENGQRLLRLKGAAQQSTLRESDPETFRRLIRESADAGDGIDAVYIRPEAALAFLDAADPTALDALREQAPSIFEQIEDVRQSGGDFVIPMDDYLMGIAPTEFGVAVADHTALEFDAMTPNEAQAFRQGLPDAIESLNQESVEQQTDFVTGEPVIAELSIDQIVEEERSLAEQLGVPVIPFSAARSEAARMVRNTRVRHLEPHRHRLTAARESRLAVEAAERGDLQAAQGHRRKQLLNAFMEQEARSAREKAKAAANYFSRVQSRPRLERLGKAGASEQVHALLARFDLNQSRTLREIDRRKSLRDWILERESEHESVIIPDRLRDEAFTTSWKELTLEELLDLENSIKNIETLARRKLEYRTKNEARELDDIRFELIESAEANLKERPKSGNLNPSDFEGVKQDVVGAEASLVRMEFLFDEWDGHEPGGPWREHVFQPIADAEADRNDLSREYTQAFAELMDELMKGDRAGYVTPKWHPQLQTRASKSELLAIALNTGNESNFQKLMEGRGWTERAIFSVLDSELSRADWNFVQATWDLIESLWPRIAEQERRLVGVVPAKVQPREVVTVHGRYRGGYFPVVYDHNESSRAFVNAEKDLYAGLETQFKRPITGHGHTIERTRAVGPLLLDLGVVAAHLDQVIHDLAYRETLTQIDRLLKAPAFKDRLNQTVGPAMTELFNPWLTSIATDRHVDNRALSGLAKGLRATRVHVTTYTLGFRYTTLAAQVLGNLNAMATLRERVPNWTKHYASGIRKAYAGLNPRRMQAVYDRVSEQSGEMRHRVGQIDRDLRDMLRRQVGKSDLGARATRASMELIGKVQLYSVDLPVWLGSYDAATVELGLDHKQSVEFADSIVRMSQGGAGQKDLAAIQRGDEGLRQLLLFYSWRNTLYNQGRASLRQFAKERDVGNLLASYTLRYWLPGIGAALIAGNLFEVEDEGELAKLLATAGLSEMVGTLPIVELSGVTRAITGVGPRFRGADSPVQRIADEYEDLANADDELEVFLGLVRSYGITFGRPLDAITNLTEDLIEEFVED